MYNELNLDLTFNNEDNQSLFNDLVQKEEIMTMSDLYYQKSRDLGTIRYFFGGYRDGVDWDGHYKINVFFSEENSIGLSIFKPVSRLMNTKKFYDTFKKDLRDYIEFLNKNCKEFKELGEEPVFSTKNIEKIVQSAEYSEDHRKVFEGD